MVCPFCCDRRRKNECYEERKNTPPGFNYNCCGGLPGFDNGVVIGLYGNKNYGYIGTELDGIGIEPFYKLVFEME